MCVTPDHTQGPASLSPPVVLRCVRLCSRAARSSRREADLGEEAGPGRMGAGGGPGKSDGVRLDKFYLDLFRQLIIYGFLAVVTIGASKSFTKLEHIYDKAAQDAELTAHGESLPFEKFKYETTEEGYGMAVEYGDLAWYKYEVRSTARPRVPPVQAAMPSRSGY